jgi:hypothetical protein
MVKKKKTILPFNNKLIGCSSFHFKMEKSRKDPFSVQMVHGYENYRESK